MKTNTHTKLSLILGMLVTLGMAGCATIGGQLNTPPEFNQKIRLQVKDDYKLHQATRSGYDPGDLQNFHTQHTLPYVIEGAFEELFGQVDTSQGPRIDMGVPDVPAIFEVQLLDIANDIQSGATTYRSEVLLSVIMKSPRGGVFWSQTFRGEGYVYVDPQFDIATSGPGNAVLDAMRDAITKMQNAIIASPEVRLQMKHYQQVMAARNAKERTT